MESRKVPPGRSNATASARGRWPRTRTCSIPAKPCRALVARPVDVAMSADSAKNARNARLTPSSGTSGCESDASSTNEVTPEDLLGDVAHSGARLHRCLLDHLERRRLV